MAVKRTRQTFCNSITCVRRYVLYILRRWLTTHVHVHTHTITHVHMCTHRDANVHRMIFLAENSSAPFNVWTRSADATPASSSRAFSFQRTVSIELLDLVFYRFSAITTVLINRTQLILIAALMRIVRWCTATGAPILVDLQMRHRTPRASTRRLVNYHYQISTRNRADPSQTLQRDAQKLGRF